MIEIFAAAGGLFTMLAFVHFFADWLFQTQHEAMHKHNDRRVRARHCTIYTVFFIPVLLILGMSPWLYASALAILWASHFIIDTYIPVLLWAKYMRKIPALDEKGRGFWDSSIGDVIGSQKAFAQLWKEPVYPILFIAVDQILHLSFLWPVVFLILL